MASTFKHRKKRNTGLTYEFLVRKLTDQIVSRDPSGRKTVEIIKGHFSPGTLLSEERELFETVMGTRGVPEPVARKILTEVASAAKKMDAVDLDRKKSLLLRDVHHTFGQGFFDAYRLPEYRVLASVQLFLDGCRSKGRLSENVTKIQLEEGIVRYMCSTTSGAAKWTQDKEVDQLVCRLAAKKFEERYGSTFNPRQKSLLELYSRCSLTGERDRVAARLYEDRKAIMTALEKNSGGIELQKDPVMKERYSEALSRLSSLDVTKADDSAVEEMLLYWKLVEEVTSNE